MANPSAAITFALFSAFWSNIFEATCNDSFSDTFATFIISRTEAVVDNAVPMDIPSVDNAVPMDIPSVDNAVPMDIPSAEQQQNLVALDLERVREFQQLIGQTAIDHIVVEDGIFSGIYSCQSNIEFQFDGIILGDGKMHRMLFSFGAILSAEIGGPKQTSSENSKYLRSLLKAYECTGGALKQDEGRYFLSPKEFYIMPWNKI
ncbi:hypothetical protein niasHT_029236 [Heterodera trifolii]|uniref:Effector protein n=1 Tax=Heterodera trifolii TaxID=157864 RepID=A0ABD2JEH6_9BILA